jgi:GGDEF domain-containing protein
MVWYVALVAIVNLGLGYALAVYLGAGRRESKATLQADTSATFEAPAAFNSAEPLTERAVAVSNGEANVALPADTSAAANSVPVADIDPATGLTTRAQIEQQLADMTLSHADLQPMTVALVEIKPAGHGDDSVEDRLLRGVADTVRELLAETQSAGRYADQQLLLLLPHDDLQHATDRAEQFRQRVAATQFVADGQEIEATLTCAIAQVAASHTAESLLEFLEETLEEARRYGGNRTFMHDGTSPTPVVPPELNIAPQLCAI